MNQETAGGRLRPSNDAIKDATKRLIELAIKWGSDKYYSHSYIEHIYGALFAGREVRRICEIGIGHIDLMSAFTPKFVPGSSLYMWSEYFPDAEIYACDIREDTLINEGRIHSMVCDQSKGEDLAEMVFAFLGDPFTNYFDVIVDDGSHVTADQIFTAQCLLPRVRKGGVYVIEDVQEPERVAAIIGGTVHRLGKRPDDNLVIIQL